MSAAADTDAVNSPAWFDHGLLGRAVDLGTVEVTAALVAAYRAAVGDPRVGSPAPPTYCLIMRRGMAPEITLPPGTFGVYGGHDIELYQPIEIGRIYRSRGWINDIFEKSGRSGSLTVVERTAEICDDAGVVAVRIAERQIVRAPGVAPAAPDRGELLPLANEAAASGSRRVAVELGDEIGPWERPSATESEVARYIGTGDMRENLFSDVSYARSLGFRGIVVPGPMLTAFLEQFLWRELRGFHLERLGSTFRQPTISGDHLVLRGAIVEHHSQPDGERVVVDLVIEHASGERAVTGSATLRSTDTHSSSGRG